MDYENAVASSTVAAVVGDNWSTNLHGEKGDTISERLAKSTQDNDDAWSEKSDEESEPESTVESDDEQTQDDHHVLVCSRATRSSCVYDCLCSRWHRASRWEDGGVVDRAVGTSVVPIDGDVRVSKIREQVAVVN